MKSISNAELNKAYFDKKMPASTQLKIKNKKCLELASTLIKENSLKKVLDLGCADCAFLTGLQKSFPNVSLTGADNSSLVEKKCLSLSLEFKQANFEKELPFSNNSFDLISCQQVIEHLQDPEFFVTEISRILKSNSFLLISTPNLLSLPNRLRMLFGKYPFFQAPFAKHPFGFHLRLFSLQKLIQLLERNNFVIQKIDSDFISFDLKHAQPKIKSVFLGSLMPSYGQRLILIAKKRN